jgi:hypothetical protein
MTADLDELLRLHGEATGGEWVDYCWSDVIAITRGAVKVDTPEVQVHICEVRGGPGGDADCKFIAAAHNALPGLVERVRRAEAAVEALRTDAAATFAKVGDIEVRNTRDANNLAAIIAERDALREVAEAARDAVANAAGHTPRETHALAIALAKVPR